MCIPQKQLFFVRMLSKYVWHLQRSSEILECVILSIVAKDCLCLGTIKLWSAPWHLSVYYTNNHICQLSLIRCESHACGLKTLISCLQAIISHAWLKNVSFAILLDTISKNMLTLTHVRSENQSFPRNLWFFNWKALGTSSGLYAS